MPPPLSLLLRKVRYTYKLRECILGQVGYYSGSLEFATDMLDDFEYHTYLIQMHLRRPDRLHKFKAPEAIIGPLHHRRDQPPSLEQSVFLLLQLQRVQTAADAYLLDKLYRA